MSGLVHEEIPARIRCAASFDDLKEGDVAYVLFFVQLSAFQSLIICESNALEIIQDALSLFYRYYLIGGRIAVMSMIDINIFLEQLIAYSDLYANLNNFIFGSLFKKTDADSPSVFCASDQCVSLILKSLNLEELESDILKASCERESFTHELLQVLSAYSLLVQEHFDIKTSSLELLFSLDLPMLKNILLAKVWQYSLSLVSKRLQKRIIDNLCRFSDDLALKHIIDLEENFASVGMICEFQCYHWLVACLGLGDNLSRLRTSDIVNDLRPIPLPRNATALSGFYELPCFGNYGDELKQSDFKMQQTGLADFIARLFLQQEVSFTNCLDFLCVARFTIAQASHTDGSHRFGQRLTTGVTYSTVFSCEKYAKYLYNYIHQLHHARQCDKPQPCFQVKRNMLGKTHDWPIVNASPNYNFDGDATFLLTHYENSTCQHVINSSQLLLGLAKNMVNLFISCDFSDDGECRSMSSNPEILSAYLKIMSLKVACYQYDSPENPSTTSVLEAESTLSSEASTVLGIAPRELLVSEDTNNLADRFLTQLGYIHWLLANSYFVQRGGAWCAEVFIKGLARSKGFYLDWDAMPDCVALTTPDPHVFAREIYPMYCRGFASYVPDMSQSDIEGILNADNPAPESIQQLINLVNKWPEKFAGEDATKLLGSLFSKLGLTDCLAIIPSEKKSIVFVEVLMVYKTLIVVGQNSPCSGECDLQKLWEDAMVLTDTPGHFEALYRCVPKADAFVFAIAGQDGEVEGVEETKKDDALDVTT